MNKFIGVGRSTKEVELRYTSGENSVAVARVTMAIDSGYGDKKKTNFVPIVAFGKTAEVMEKYLQKGKMFAVEGEYTTGSYEKDGKTIYTTTIKADKIEIIEWGEKKKDDIPDGFIPIDDNDPFM